MLKIAELLIVVLDKSNLAQSVENVRFRPSS